MKAKEILRFMLSACVPAVDCGIKTFTESETYSETFDGLCDDMNCKEGEYFWCQVYGSEQDCNLYRKKLLSYGSQKACDVELPTFDGWIYIVKIEE